MNRIKFTVIKNSLANLVRGGATAIVALVLPHFLVRLLDHDRFAAWALMLQIAAYANYLDFGLQTSLARFFAQAMEQGQRERGSQLASTAFVLLLFAMLIACVGVGVFLWLMPSLLPSLPLSLVKEVQIAAGVLSLSTLALLPLSAFTGVLVGIHRNEYPATAIGLSRLIGGFGVVLLASHGFSLVSLASCIAVANILGGLSQIWFVSRLVPDLRVLLSLANRKIAWEMANFSGGLMVWSLSGLLVSGLDLTILGCLDFKSVGSYSIASTLVTFVAGLNAAVCGALMTPIAALHAAGSRTKITAVTIHATWLATYLNILFTVGLFLAGNAAMTLWVGLEYAHTALPILKILILATSVRLVASPYAAMLIATGQQRQGIAQGIVEGCTNLFASLILGYRYGAVGIATGTLIGAACGLAWACTLTLSWVRELPIERREFLVEGMLRPIACTLPLILFVILFDGRSSGIYSSLMFVACCAATWAITAKVGRGFLSPRRLAT